MVQWLKLRTPNAEALSSIPGQGTRSHMQQLKILYAATETRRRQVNKNTKRLSDPTIGHTPEKITIQKTHMYPNVHSSTIYNCQDIEAPRCPLIDEWIKNLWSIHTMEYCVHAQLLSCCSLQPYGL